MLAIDVFDPFLDRDQRRDIAPSAVLRQTGGRARCRVLVEGVVQGVGFRPFVYRLAQRCRLAGCVRNDGRGVLIELQGEQSVIQRFLDALVSEAPAAARLRA